MLSHKARLLMKAVKSMGTSLSIDEEQQPLPKIMSIFMVAFAIQKFQKFESNKYKRKLGYHFDKRAALNRLNALAADDTNFFLEDFVMLAYFVRKFKLTAEDVSCLNGGPLVSSLMKYLKNQLNQDPTTTDHRRLHFSSVSLKLLLTGNNSTSLQDILEVIEICKICKNSDILDELVFVLMQWFETQDKEVETETHQHLVLSILEVPNLKPDARAFFQTKTSTKKAIGTQALAQETSKPLTIPKVKKNQQVVSKTIQTVKSKQESKSSEEVDFQFLNLTNAMKSRNRKVNFTTVQNEDLENINKEGDDRSMWRNTWYEVLNLYSLVSRGEALKADDKDNYLPSKLFGTHYFRAGDVLKSDRARIYSFFINRMCVSMFQNVSQRQQLNSQAVDKLMECIKDFQSMVGFLKLKDNFAEMFVDVVFANYWEIKEVTEPDMAVSVFKEIRNQTTEEYVDRGWFYNSDKVRRKAHNQDSIRELIVAEINKLRLDAIQAIHKAAVRNKKDVLTKGRLEKITAYAKHQSQDVHPDSKFVDHIIDLMELAESLDDFDYKETFQLYLGHLEKCTSLEKRMLQAVLKFMRNQARDEKRSRELFNDNILSTLIHCLAAAHSEECTSFVVFILSEVFRREKGSFLKDQDFVEAISSKLLCNDLVRLDNEDGERVVFERQSKDDVAVDPAKQIPFLTARILWISVENKVFLSSATIDNLILVLTDGKSDENKQLKIMAARCLHGLTRYMSFTGDHLNQLLELINSPIYDVSIYIQAAYVKGCTKVAFAPLPTKLDAIHLENISALYVTDSLKLKQDDYEEEINKSLFKALLYEARKQEFPDQNLFLLFENILNLNGKYASQVLAILVAYTAQFVVPETTVRTLENLLTVSSYFDKALLILENIIRDGQLPVTNKTLNVFADYLQSSSSGRQRFYSFKLLEQASQNQQLPDEVFYKTELVRAGYALEFSKGCDRNAIIQCIQELVDKGVPLPVDTREALQKDINQEGVLRLFATASRNKQIIDEHLLDAFVTLFNPAHDGEINQLLIAIFENAAKNNQKLPDKLLVKLETALCKHNAERVLPVFIFLAQKGKALSSDVNKKLLDKLSSVGDPVLKQELLSSLGSLIEANPQGIIGLHLPQVNSILIREIRSENHNIQKLCIHAISKLVSISQQVDDQLLEELVQVGIDLNADKNVRHEMKALFDLVIKDSFNPLIAQKGFRGRIDMANLTFKSPEDLLARLRCYVKLEGGFVLQNYKEIKGILDNGSMKLQGEALQLLLDCSCKSGITDELLETVSIMYESTVSKSLKNSCLQLLIETVADGKTLTGRAEEIWKSRSQQDEHVKMFMESEMCRELREQLQLHEKDILKLLELVPDAGKLSSVTNLIDFIQMLTDDDTAFCSNQAFVLLMEQCSLNLHVLEAALPCYCRIIKKTKRSNVDCLEELAHHFVEEDSELLETVFEAMYFASKSTTLPNACILFAWHHLNNVNGVVRGYSFGILRSALLKGVSEALRSFCDAVVDSLAQNCGVKIEKAKPDMELLEILTTVQFLDYEILLSKDKKIWKRELLASDLFEKWKFFQMDQVDFYSHWFVVEKKFSYHKSCKILALIHKCQFEGPHQLNQLIRMVSDLCFDDAERFLVLHSPEVYEGFKQAWCTVMLQARVSDQVKAGVSVKYMETLAKKLCTTFDVECVRMLMLSLKSVDNLFAFEDLIGFCAREQIALEPILVGRKKLQMKDLRQIIEKDSLDIKRLIFEHHEEKLSWTEKKIQLWSKDIKKDKQEFTDYEAIAIIYRGNFLITGHRLTDTQILCCLIALRGGKLHGKLLEVATGEGKSTIICILAIINALRGKKVDVITSSPVLAERDAKQKAKLYRMFSLTCADNNDKTAYLKGRKDCYKADIVYGEMSQFQFDILRDNYSKLGTLGERQFMTAIVDEVDSMLIDDSSKIARLSSTVPGMDHFQPIYVFIWQHLMVIKEKFIMFNNQMYFVNGKVDFENGKITLEVAAPDGNIFKIEDLEEHILTAGNQSPVSEPVDDIDEYLRKALGQYIDAQIKQNKLYIPSNFTEFLAKQKSKWIINAVEALNYVENIHYVVQDGEIRPVDYHSTGIVQNSTSWSDGLHQFLQLKHNLKMTSETLTTNFLSNIGFMGKYEQVYGLTGTLGSTTARSVLEDVYKVELINVPQRRQKQFLVLPSVVAEGESKWLNAIMANVALEIKKERGILVICETIEHANRISGMLKSKMRSSAVKLYTMNNMDQEKNVEKIQPGEVIIATNLAGRGTDIQTDDIEETGGLHVILSFMPSNQRVEDQAFGRTARQGKRGTGLMILNANNLIGFQTIQEDVKKERDRMESRQLMDFKEKDLKLIQVKDQLFDLFCTFLNNEIRQEIRSKQHPGRKLKSLFTELLPTTYETCVLAAVEEQWAGFLSKLDEGIIACKDALLLEQKQPGFPNSDLYKQLNMKATILGSYIRGVNSCIDAIKRSKRLIDVVSVHEQHGKLKMIIGNTSKKISFKHFNELERNEKEKHKFLDRAVELSSTKNSLTFNSLTTREDSGTKDQAWQTLNNAYDEELLPPKSKTSRFTGDEFKCLPEDYKDIAISLQQVDLARIEQDLFHPDKEYKDLARESAVAKLKEQRSYIHAACRYLNSEKATLRITSANDISVKMTYDDADINYLIEVVEDVSSDTSLRFDLLFKGANENKINQTFQKGGNESIRLKVSFENLDKEGAREKVKAIKAASADVEFVTNKANFLELLQKDTTLQSGLLNSSERNCLILEEVDRKELLKRVEELKSDETQFFIKLNNLSLGDAASIIGWCQEMVMFSICFNDVYDYYGSGFKEGPVSFCFEGMDKENAEMVIKLLREKNFEFCLQFNNLSDKQLRFILKSATLEQEHMKITKVKNISELFLGQSLPKLELNEFTSKGLEYIIEMNEELFIPWRSVCIVAVLATGQVLAGGALMITGFGGPLGMALVTEGISDAFVAYRAYNTRQFRWSDYCLQKSVSLALSAATLGFSKWKDAAKGIETVTSGAGKEVLEQAATQVITNQKAVAATLKATGQNLKSLTCKFIATKGAEAATREALNMGIQILSNLCFESLKPEISASVQSSVRRSFDNPELKEMLYKMYAIDMVTNKTELQSRVEQIVAEIISPQQGVMNKMWSSVGLPLLKGVLADSSRYASTISMGIRIIGTLNGLKQVLTLTDTIVQALIKKLKLVDKSSMTIALVLHSRYKINKEKAKTIAIGLKSLGIIDEFDNLSKPHEEVGAKIEEFSLRWQRSPQSVLEEWAAESNDVEKSIGFLQGFHETFGKIEMDSFSMIMKSVSDRIAQQLIQIMDSQLLQPWSTLAVSGLTDALSKRIQHHLVDESENSDSQKADQKKYDELSKKENLTPEEKAFMSSYSKFRTFAEQYNYNSKDYCIAYSQAEMAYYAGKEDESGSQSAGETVSETANNVRKGWPANVATMIAAAKVNGVNLKVVDNKDYVLTEEDKANGVEVVYVEHGKDNQIGHAYYMDSTSGQFKEAESSGFDCFYAAFSKVLETKGINKTVTDLRSEVAQHMESNGAAFSKVVAAQEWIRETHPEASNSLLFTAGLHKDPTTGELKLDDGDLEALLRGLLDPSCRRGGPHMNNFKGSFEFPYNLRFEDCNSLEANADPKLHVDEGSKRISLQKEQRPKGAVTPKGGEGGWSIKTQSKRISFAVQKTARSRQMSGGGQFKEAESSGFDCFYAAFSKVLETKGINKTVTDLRSEVAQHMESNGAAFSKVVAAQEWIRETHPEASNSLLFTAGLHKDPTTGELKLDDGDLEALLRGLLDPSCRRGGPHMNNFKRKFPKTAGPENDEPDLEQSCHHVIANEEVVKSALESLATSSGDGYQFNPDRIEENTTIVEELINRAPVKSVIENLLDGEGKLKKPDENLKPLLTGAVAWNPNNIVRGPDPKIRARDPEHQTRQPGELNIDKEIKESQPPEYQEAVERYEKDPSFENFAAVPPLRPVQWGITNKDNKNRKYGITSPDTQVCVMKKQILSKTMATKTDQNPPSSLLLMDIRNKFETFKYVLLRDAPCILQMKHSDVFLHKDGLLSSDEVIKRLSAPQEEKPGWIRDWIWNTEKVLSTKLSGSGAGDYEFYLQYLPTGLVQSREKFDTLLAKQWESAVPSDNVLRPSDLQTVERIPFTEALDRFHVELSCKEAESMTDAAASKEQLRKLVCEILGPDHDKPGEVSFRNFRQLFYDGNDM
ncbi:unnamed protein product, partial [Cyprideis torosa]